MHVSFGRVYLSVGAESNFLLSLLIKPAVVLFLFFNLFLEISSQVLIWNIVDCFCFTLDLQLIVKLFDVADSFIHSINRIYLYKGLFLFLAPHSCTIVSHSFFRNQLLGTLSASLKSTRIIS